MKNKIKVIILIGLIILFNIITVYMIIYLLKDNMYYDLFDTPDCILVTNGETEVKLYPGDNGFNDILTLNATRILTVEDNLLNDLPNKKIQSNDLCICYIFEKERNVNIGLKYSNKQYCVNEIQFILTGENNNCIIIDTDILGTLNSNSKLIEKAYEVLYER